MMRRLCLTLLGFLLILTTMQSQNRDLTKEPTLYVVGYAHLDTQWRWDYPTTILQYLTKTMHVNFDLFEKYPNYVFNFTGSNRYRLMKEYFPADYEKVKQYIAAGRWFPAGSSVEEGDVNAPSAEAIIREILYGNRYFLDEFGKASSEYMLPDCFGFPASLPSILAHAGVIGFSTQKLSPAWQPGARVGGPGSIEETPEGIPFNVGIWEGPDGRSIIAALNPGSYGSSVTYDLSKSPEPNSNPNSRNVPIDWEKRIALNGKVSGLFADYRYYGTGDTGGAPNEASVKWMDQIISKSDGMGNGSVHVISARADEMFRDIRPDQTARLPRYKGDLELINHSAGSLTSQAYHKRWNRQNELLADAAEKASVAAAWLGARTYPQKRLTDAWTLVMGGHFHDNMAGTATPKAYEYTWNDDVIAMNQFEGVLTSATEAVVSVMNTQARGTPVAVYNPLSIAREDVVEATIAFPGGTPKAVRVLGPDGREVPAQLSSGNVLFVAKAPSVGFSVYDVQPSDAPSPSTLKVTESSLENARYRVSLNSAGDVSSIFDKTLNRELLSGPARLAIQQHDPRDWPAWNMDYDDQQKPPRSYVAGPAKIRVVENGPVRVAVEIERQTEGSTFVQTVRLSAGDAGNRVEFANAIDWKTQDAALKASFPFAASNPEATYNWDIGTIQRGNNDDKKFEVASHQWFDLTDKSGAFGVTVLSDCKNGSDKPDDNTLRLTLIYTPGLGEGNGRAYADQLTQDIGHHEFVYGLAGHAGDWRREQSDWQGLRLNQPLIAFETSSHAGALGKAFSLLSVSSSRVRVMALKKAETSDEVIVRLVEADGRPQSNVRVTFPVGIQSIREVNGQEQPLDSSGFRVGGPTRDLVTNFTPYQPRTYAVRLLAPTTKAAPRAFQTVALPFDLSVTSHDNTRSVGGFDASGHAMPAEMLPPSIDYAGIRFSLGDTAAGKPNALVTHGQTIALPRGGFTRVYVLAASADGDQRGTFRVGEKSTEVVIQDWGGYVGQWDDRIWRAIQVPVAPPRNAPPGTAPTMRTNPYGEMIGLKPGFIKPASIAWYSSHHHSADGANQPYAYSYLFAYSIDLPAGATSVTLPNNDKIRILAMTVSD
jgi:alpha-mannosidase